MITTTEERTAPPAEIATLAAAAHAQVFAYRDGNNDRFKFKFGEGAWTPPFAADEAVRYLNKEVQLT